MTTNDAEAIARIIDPNAFRGAFLSTQPSLSKDLARAKAAAILSYLASRQEAQEPVAWLRDVDGTGSLHPASKGDPGAFPVYTAPPAPAGEVERLRGAIKRQVENIDRWRETGEPASQEESKSIYEQLVAAINGVRHD